jgi:hypothetical protein
MEPADDWVGHSETIGQTARGLDFLSFSIMDVQFRNIRLINVKSLDVQINQEHLRPGITTRDPRAKVLPVHKQCCRIRSTNLCC